MGIGRLLHSHPEHPGGGGTIDRPRAYEVFTTIGFAGQRRLAFTRLAALSAAHPGDRVLDVGCGTGYLTRLLAAAIAPSGQVTGIDPSPPMVEYARRNAPLNCSYLVGEGQDLNFPDASFDVVASSLAVHHIPAEARPTTLREMYRVLRPGGRLLIAEFRPPANCLAARLAGALAGPAVRHSPIGLLAELITGAGFRLEAEGDLRPMLHYFWAMRPTGTAQAED